jgi:Yip1 domain
MNIVERVKAIILSPVTEWPVIERESGDVTYLFMNYVAILALIPAVCGFIGTSIIGVSIPGAGTFRVPIFSGLFHAVLGYVLTFVVVYVVGLIIDLLAPTFAGQKNSANALKLAVYSFTPAWLAGIFQIIPGLAFLGILGLYGFYLLWVGLPILMKTPKEKALLYTIAVVVCALVLQLIVGGIVFGLVAYPR